MKTILLTSIQIFCLLSFSLAQTQATTKDGREVVLNSDGTWKYVESNGSSNGSVSLECSELVSSKVDKMTGETSVSASEAIIVSDDGKEGIAIYLLQGNPGGARLIFILKAIGAGNCIDDDDKMNVLFSDGSRLEIENDGDFNCDAEFTVYFGGVFGKKREWTMLKEKRIESMRVWTTKGYVEEDFTEDQGEIVKATINCLAK